VSAQEIRLPVNPSPKQLRSILGASLRGAFAVADESPAELQYQLSFLTAKEVLGTQISPELIRRSFRTLNWSATFKRLASIAADLHSTGTLGKFQEAIKHTLVSNKHPHPFTAMLAVGLEPHVNSRRPILHEQVLYTMFQLAAEECDESRGRDPNVFELALLALMVNDHLDRGYVDMATEHGAFASSISLALRFNHSRDHLRTIARAASILTDALPANSELARTPATWLAIQERAFGSLGVLGFLQLFAQPLVMFADTQWGPKSVPSLNLSRWYRNAPELLPTVEAWIEPMTTTREEIRASGTGDPIPNVSPLLLKKPFVRFEDDHWAASPSAVMRQLQTGVRVRLLRAAAELGRREQKMWEHALGLMIEAWCQQVARWAASSDQCRGVVHVPNEAGAEDIDDVVVVDNEVAIVFSVKSTLMREHQGFNISAKTGIVEWYEEFLFAEKRGSLREGAARLLNKKVEAIRSGRTSLPRNVKIIPVIVMYDEPLEHVGVIDWWTRRCSEEKLFGASMPLMVITIDMFEALMSLLARGRDLGDMLTSRQSQRWRRQRLDVFLAETIPDWRQVRLPAIQDRFDAIAAAGLQALKDVARID
jgi:hypothetical protein